MSLNEVSSLAGADHTYAGGGVRLKSELLDAIVDRNYFTSFMDKVFSSGSFYHADRFHSSAIMLRSGISLTSEANSGVKSNLYCDNLENNVSTKSAESFGNYIVAPKRPEQRMLMSKVGSQNIEQSNNLYKGSDEADTVKFLGKDNIVYAGDGDDFITLQQSSENSISNDLIYGQYGDDVIAQNSIMSNTSIHGGDGNDSMTSHAIHTSMIGGNGYDSYVLYDTVEKAIIQDIVDPLGTHVSLYMRQNEQFEVELDGNDLLITFQSQASDNKNKRKVWLKSILGNGGANINIIKIMNNGDKNINSLSEEELLTLANHS
ncbi:hypothetical protein [Vibrio coralliilyticus]|uniref:hypothetical protein n=1 Tax=Vibrio coralliilyticus TaxID=190893 RepID=UPI001E5C0A49|nr:hypothetical protein [Vibrio coralliilyticus]MCC2525802.1 hypothetical protein [Vibrio coralliilyticus]